MSDWQRIVDFENEIQAGWLRSMLEDRDIPYRIRSYHDLAYNGLFQYSKGWGYLEAPAEFRDEILEIFNQGPDVGNQDTES